MSSKPAENRATTTKATIVGRNLEKKLSSSVKVVSMDILQEIINDQSSISDLDPISQA
jgi:hypothetical protein